MPNSSLKKFAQAIPVCEQTCGLAAALEMFHTSGCDAVVVVNSLQNPLGVIHLRQVMPHLLAAATSENRQQVKSQTTWQQLSLPEEFRKPLCDLKPSLIQPLAILPAQMSLCQFWAYLQGENDSLTPDEENTGCQPQEQYALVNQEGKFIGVLNSWHILKSIAPHFKSNDPVHSAGGSPSQNLQPLLQLLEQLPLPLSLQTATGQVLVQNLPWRQQIGTGSTWDDLGTLAPANAVHAGGSSVPSSESTAPPANNSAWPTLKSAERRTTSVWEQETLTHSAAAQVAVQSYCAIATPYTTATVSPIQVLLSAPAVNKPQPAPIATDWEVSASVLNARKTSQERIFSFIKIPLRLFVSLDDWDDSTPASTSQLYVILAQDKTEQQQVAQELAAKNADLVHLNRLKDEFLACISHELKTPLTAVLGLSTLLKDQTLGELNERQARYARLIYQSGRQLMAVVNDILDLTRIETGQLELALEPVQIQNVCDRAYSQARQLHLEKDSQEEDASSTTQFTLDIEPSLQMFIADELRLRQMLVHLLSNALKFTAPDGQIGLKVNRWEGWITFTVWDTGIGIPPEKQHLIFQKFQQLEKPLTRRFEGTGLGLVLTQNLARLHGGDVSFISKPNQGSEFTLLLPPCPPLGNTSDGDVEQWDDEEIAVANALSANLNSATCNREQYGNGNRLVLIVENVPRYLDDLTEQLKSLGYWVVVARSGTEALSKARKLQPCAILLNPLLPHLSGWDVLTLLKSDDQTHHIPVLVTATQAEKQQANHNQADGFLSLPVQRQALLESLLRLGQQQNNTSSGLTILHLCPELGEMSPNSSVPQAELTDTLCLQLSELNYRVLEADDLEQAELLARVWHPDVILLEGSGITDPLSYMQQFALHPNLTTLPLVTLDHSTTQAANQIPGLSVYPCLASDHSVKIAALLQVVQVAAGMSRRPNLVIMDVGEPEQDTPIVASYPPTGSVQHQAEHSLAPESSSPTSVGVEPSTPSPIVTPSTWQSSWLQALKQYLQAAGYRSLLMSSWDDVCRQLQEQSVDLLVIRLRDSSDTLALVNSLTALTKLPTRPPILVLDHRLNAPACNEASTHSPNSFCKLESLLVTLGTQIVQGHSQSMPALLAQIHQILTQHYNHQSNS